MDNTPIDPKTGKPYPGGKQPVINAEVGRLLEQEGVAVIDMVGGSLRDVGRLPQRPNVPMLLGYTVAQHRYYTGLLALNFRLIAQQHGVEPMGTLEPTLLVMQALTGGIIETPLMRYVNIERDDVHDSFNVVCNSAWRELFLDAPPAVNSMLELVRNNHNTPENPVTKLVTFASLCADLIALTEEAATGNLMVSRLIAETLNYMREIKLSDGTPMQNVYHGIIRRFEQLFGEGGGNDS